ncbi:MAG: restriction endonuclease subunit S [Paludibacteraceae bacterium]|nr:restriction endonuclease subunit S [Paludibacteraceae bacterium]
MATIILGDIVEVIKETVHNPQESGFQYFVGLEHYDSGEPLITRYATPDNLTSSVKHFAKGDILVARRNVYLKRASLVDFEGVTSGDSIVLRAKDKKYQQILPFILNSDDFWDYAEQNSDGTMSKRLSPADLLDYEFEELENIELLADKLWAAYRVKESYKKLLAATDDMLKAKFATLVLNKEWPTEKLSKIATYSIGLTYKPSEVTENGIIVLRSGNIQDSHIILEDVVRVTTKIKDNLYVQKDDILMCSRNGSAQLVGKVALIPELIEPMTFGAFMTIIRSKYSRYLLLYFQTKEFRKQLSGSKSSVMNQVTQKMLDEIIIPIPDTKTIDELVNIATQAEATKESLRKSIENIDQVIKSLINQ